MAPPTTTATTTTTTNNGGSDDDRRRELQAFDDTKLGVKGLVDAGINSIPAIFHHPPEVLNDMLKTTTTTISPPPSTTTTTADEPSSPTIPVVDLAVPRHDDLVAQIRHAAGTVGFFWLVNHGVPEHLMSGMLAGVREFNEGPTETKQSLYSRDPTRSLRFASNFDLFRSGAADWRDTLFCEAAPRPPPPEALPAPLRGVALEYGAAVAALARRVSGLLSQALGLPADHLVEEMECLDNLNVVCQYYPPCPEPHRTVGVKRHTDPGFFTILLQDGLGGLQVRLDRGGNGGGGETWVDIAPRPGALMVNVGDLLQLVTNDRFRSVEHRVPANRSKDTARVSVASFFNTDVRTSERLYGPIPEPGKPPVYRSVTAREFIAKFNGIGLDGRALDHFRLDHADATPPPAAAAQEV